MTDMDQIKELIKSNFEQTNKKIESIQTALQTDISTIHTNLGQHNDRITSIEQTLGSLQENSQIDDIKIQIETLKQERLRNNIRLTGLPPIAFNDPTDTVMGIEDVLQLGLIPSDFTVYADRNKSSLIISFANHPHKRIFMNALQQRKSLLAEEIFPAIQSSSNIYANDQLTPYFAQLFQAAWQAKKSGFIYSASSLGGRIKVKHFETSPTIIIDTQRQLDEILKEERQDTAQNPTERSSNQRNDDIINSKNNNNSNKNNNVDDSSTNDNSSQAKGHQPASNNPALQQYIASRSQPQPHNRSTVNRFSSKIRADLQNNRANSKDRAYRGRVFDKSPQPQPYRHSNNYRSRAPRRSASPTVGKYGRGKFSDYTDPRAKYGRNR